MLKLISNTPLNFQAYLTQVFQKKYLLYILIKRELKIKYKKTFLGLSWVLLQPLLVVTVYTLFFKNMLKLNTYDVPYPQYVLTGLVLWYLSTGIISKSMHALFESKELISKVSFPKILILITKITPVIIECVILLFLSVFAVFFTSNQISLNILTSLFYFIDVIILSFSIGIICALIALWFRDFAEILPFIINFAIWLTPIFYAFGSVPDNYKNFFRYGNPLIIPLEGMRDAFFGSNGITSEALFTFLITAILLLISVTVFVKFEKRITEKI
jgi:lipopolysaccharide transport system permease protein